MTFASARLYGNVYIPVGVARALADLSDFGLMGSKFRKMGDSLPGTPINHRTKWDAASFILGGEIPNCTNKQTHTQTVNNISTPCLWIKNGKRPTTV